jgi:glycosyltransferase involved in cell wall biosynthesis
MPSTPSSVISVVLPAHNECECLPAVTAAVFSELARLNVTAEVIVVDDGSTDGTRELMMTLCAKNAGLRYIRLSRNFGKEAAITAGLVMANGHAVIVMDSDGQHPTELIPVFVEHWRKGMDIVYASQIERRDPPWLKFMKGSFYRMLKVGSSVDIPANAGDFRLLDRKVIEAIKTLPERNRFMKGLYGWVGFKSEIVPYTAATRLSGRSRYSMRRLVSLGLTGITSFSVAPLRFVSVAGIVVSMASVLYGCYLIYEHFFEGGQLPGWATLAVGMMFLSGVQLLSLGIIAEYLGRVFEEVKGRPLYVVAEDSRMTQDNRPSEPVREAKVVGL